MQSAFLTSVLFLGALCYPMVGPGQILLRESWMLGNSHLGKLTPPSFPRERRNLFRAGMRGPSAGEQLDVNGTRSS
jgi:hypothetical protein